MPHEPRARAFAVRGFNVEVAKVGEQVSQNQIGFMRIQFWEDAIDLCFQDDPQRVPKHPIAVELYKVSINFYIIVKSFYLHSLK